MVLTDRLGIGPSRLDRIAGRVQVLCCRRPPLLLLRLIIAFNQLVDVDVKLQKLLSYEVFDEFIIINKLFIVDLGAALQFHLFGVVLPLDLDLYQRFANQFQHFLRVTDKLHPHVE